MTDKLFCVECHSGYQADQRPLRVFLDGQLMDVTAGEDRWYSPGSTYFRVLVSTGQRYILCRQEAQDLWTVKAFRATNS